MWTIPLKVRQKVAASLRTAWSVFLILLLMQFWQWSPIALYLSPVVTIISSTSYFGLWQANAFKVAYATLLCTALGVLVGLSFKIKALQVVLIFLCIAWVNTLNWDRVTVILGSLSLLLAAVWPTLTDGAVTGWKSFGIVLALVNIPYLVTGVSLLFPRPALAIYTARFQALIVCQRLSNLITAVIKAFLSFDDMDICTTEFDEFYSAVVADVAVLKQLTVHVDHERLLFVAAHDMPASLQIFIEITELLLQELVSIKEQVKRISFNRTHERFAQELQPALQEMREEMEIALTIVGERFDSFDPFKDCFPACLRQVWAMVFNCELIQGQSHPLRQRMSAYMDIPTSQELIDRHHLRRHQSRPRAMSQVHHQVDGMQHYSFTNAGDVETGPAGVTVDLEQDILNRTEENAQHPISSAESLFHHTIVRLSLARSQLLRSYSEVRKEYILFRPSLKDTCQNNAPAKVQSVEAIMSLLSEEEDLIEERRQLALSDDEGEGEHHLLKLSMREETMRLSLRNFGARGAFMHRISVVVEYIASLKHTLANHQKPFNSAEFFSSHLKVIIAYPSAVFCSLVAAVNYCAEQMKASTNMPLTLFALLSMYLSTYSAAIKTASAVAITISVLIFELMPFLYQGGLWMALVVVIVRQEYVSSSFLTSVQRMEGTVIGAMYAFLIYTIFQCDTSQCGYSLNIPVLVIWVAVCGMFRGGAQHGYSATVASFTPMILLLGTDNTVVSAWGRIEETFLGIAIYLTIDNLFWPKRTYPAIKVSVLNCIEQTRLVFNECVQGVQKLVELEHSYSVEEQQSSKAASVEELEPEDDIGVYGMAADVRYRSGSMTFDIVENSGSRRSVRSRSMSAGAGTTTPQPPLFSEPTAPLCIQELLASCSTHFSEAEKRLVSMRGELEKQSTLVNLAHFEPELWHRSFPQAAYLRLLESFTRVYRSALALNCGSREFVIVMCQMMRRKENVSEHLSYFKYMINHIFAISAKADESMKDAHTAFTK